MMKILSIIGQGYISWLNIYVVGTVDLVGTFYASNELISKELFEPTEIKIVVVARK